MSSVAQKGLNEIKRLNLRPMYEWILGMSFNSPVKRAWRGWVNSKEL
jgi:hypothetical protein